MLLLDLCNGRDMSVAGIDVRQDALTSWHLVQNQNLKALTIMEFNGNKSIYLQICDGICERILSGELEPDMRIPSVREYGAEIGVNPNTVMRSYEKLTSDNIIYNRRGIGYFISQDAKQIVLQTMKRDFLENEMPQIIKKMHLLGISLEELQVIEK